MQIQSIKIDVMAYMYNGYENYLNSFYEKAKEVLKKKFDFLDVFIEEDGIHITSEIENEIEWETDDEFNFKGAGHYNGVMRRKDFLYELNKLLKKVDTDGCYSELDDNSDFGDSDLW